MTISQKTQKSWMRLPTVKGGLWAILHPGNHLTTRLPKQPPAGNGGGTLQEISYKNSIIGLGCISFLSLTMHFNMETFLKVGTSTHSKWILWKSQHFPTKIVTTWYTSTLITDLKPWTMTTCDSPVGPIHLGDTKRATARLTFEHPSGT